MSANRREFELPGRTQTPCSFLEAYAAARIICRVALSCLVCSEKALDKYGSDFRLLTDLARMVVVCPKFSTVTQVLTVLNLSDGWKVLRIKNRLMDAFDATKCGGYRDMLVNLRCTATRHVVEVQLVMHSMYHIKASSSDSDAAYRLAFLFELFAPKNTQYQGNLSRDVLERIHNGLIRVLHSRGAQAGLSRYFGDLCKAVQSPACTLTEIRIPNCDWPEGKSVADMLSVLAVRGAELRIVGLANERRALPCELPPAFFTRCPNLEFLAVAGSNVRGTIPAEVGGCIKLRKLYLHENLMEGEVPFAALQMMSNLGHIDISKNPSLTLSQSAKEKLQKTAPNLRIDCDASQLVGLG